MASKFITLCTLFVAANAGLLPAGVTTYAAAPVVGYSPANEVSHSYSSIAAPATLSYAAPVAQTYSYAAPATVAVSSPAIASTQQNVVRSFGGTVSQYSKAVDTPFSSVRKYDTRINNNVYTPAIAKTLAYAAPGVVAHAAPTVYSAQPAPAVYGAQPAIYSAYAPSIYSAHATPAVQTYATKPLTYSPATAVAHVSFNGYGATYGW